MWFRKRGKDVLVVGAGPVGQLTALLLAEKGVDVDVIDAERTASRPYAVMLHPASLQILDEIGLAADVLALGQRIDSVELCDATGPRAAIELGNLPGAYPFALTIVLDDLERLVERRLRALGVKVRWNYRLGDLRSNVHPMVAQIDKIGMVTAGYPIAHQEWEMQGSFPLETGFVIGADGAHSTVRRRLGFELSEVAPASRVLMFEGDADPGTKVGHALRVAFHEAGTSAFWPLPGNRWRCIFEVPAGKLEGQMHRRDLRAPLEGWALRGVDQDMLRALIAERAPWFSSPGLAADFGVELWVERRVVEHFGQGRVWLVGDSAHMGAPLASDSLNFGLREAQDLAGRVTHVLGGGDADLLSIYDAGRVREWWELLTAQPPPRTSSRTPPWVAAHAGRLGTCIPASGIQLGRLFEQLGVALA